MRRWVTSAVLFGLVAILLVAVPVLAYSYRATYTVSENGTASYDMLPVIGLSNNDWMIDNGFITDSTALDTRIETLGGLDKPHLVTNNMTLTAVPVPQNSQTNLYYTTGDSLLSAFDIILGSGGYITVSDNATLELGDNFTVEHSGWVDTSVGAVSQDAHTTGDDGNQDIYGVYWKGQTVNITGGYTLDYISLKMSCNGTPNTVGVSIRATSGGLPTGANLTSGTTDGNTFTTNTAGEWYSVNLTDYDLVPNTAYAIVVNAPAGDGSNLVRWRVDSTEGYGDGQFVYSTDSGGSWATDAYDAMFNLYGDGLLVYKADAFRTYNSGAGEITSEITGATNVTATGVSSGEHDVTTTLNDPMDIALSFDGITDNASVNDDATLQIADDITIECWVKPLVANPTGWILNKSHFLSARWFGYSLELFGAGGVRAWFATSSGADNNIAGGSLSKDTWTHIVATHNDGGLDVLYQDGSEVNSESALNTLTSNNGDNLTFGYRQIYYANMTLDNVRIYSRILGLPEIEANYALGRHGAPSDTTGLAGWWEFNEGTGTSSADSSANTNTANVTGCDWDDRAFKIYVDGVEEDYEAGTGVSVPDNANDWLFCQNDVLPYSDNHTMEIDDARQLWFSPNNIITGTTLPDRQGGDHNGTITWGSNPAGVSVSLGGMVGESQPVPGALDVTPTPDILPEVEVTDWFVEPDVSGTLLTNPMRPFVTIMSDTTTLTELQAWRILAFAFVLLVTVSTARAVRGHHAITGFAAGAAMLGMVVLTIFPMWALVFTGLFIFGGLIAERSPVL